MIAGVPAAVVSQWQIGDSASKTPRLTRAFYENLKYGKDVATPFQSAMIELSNDPKSESARDNIFDWGPFLVFRVYPLSNFPRSYGIHERLLLPDRKPSSECRGHFPESSVC
jgi:CHAT domain-containing protein